MSGAAPKKRLTKEEKTALPPEHIKNWVDSCYQTYANPTVFGQRKDGPTFHDQMDVTARIAGWNDADVELAHRYARYVLKVPTKNDVAMASVKLQDNPTARKEARYVRYEETPQQREERKRELERKTTALLHKDFPEPGPRPVPEVDEAEARRIMDEYGPEAWKDYVYSTLHEIPCADRYPPRDNDDYW